MFFPALLAGSRRILGGSVKPRKTSGNHRKSPKIPQIHLFLRIRDRLGFLRIREWKILTQMVILKTREMKLLRTLTTAAPVSSLSIAGPVGSSPVGSSPAGSSPAGSSPVGSSPVSSSPLTAGPAGSSLVVSIPPHSF
jgi:hypothetical protein